MVKSNQPLDVTGLSPWHIRDMSMQPDDAMAFRRQQDARRSIVTCYSTPFRKSSDYRGKEIASSLLSSQ